MRRMLWKIRTKLILSYLFIAVVPVVLLTTLFVLAGVFFSGLLASHLVTAEVDRKARLLETAAESVLDGLALEQADPARVLPARLAAARRVHPELSHALVSRGRTLSAQGSAPLTLPAWWKGGSFAGLVRTPEGELLRAVRTQGDAFLALDVPLDAPLFGDLQKRVGIRLLTAGGTVSRRGGGVQVDVDEDETRVFGGGDNVRLSGMPFVAFAERTDWETGETDLDPLAFEYRPWEMLRRLSPGSLNAADLLVRLLAIVGVVFLVMYAVALLLGLLLARSITGSVHALSLGTERLQRGDFDTPIRVGSRDQLGELAGSFNHMARGFKDLLRQQAEKERLEEELRIARQIQMSLLPPQGGQGLPGVHIAALCVPAAEVGGDYYDLLPLSDTRMGVLVADVSGKGTSAALYMAELKGLVLSLSRIYDSPARLLVEANRILSPHMDSRSFITMTYAVVDTQARTMRYARAGHNPIIQREARTGATRVLAPAGLGLGLDPGVRFEQILEEAELKLESGDLFLLFTDGLSEAMNERSELFGEARLRAVLEGSDTLGSEEVKERILGEIRGFVGTRGAARRHDARDPQGGVNGRASSVLMRARRAGLALVLLWASSAGPGPTSAQPGGATGARRASLLLDHGRYASSGRPRLDLGATGHAGHRPAGARRLRLRLRRWRPCRSRSRRTSRCWPRERPQASGFATTAASSGPGVGTLAESLKRSGYATGAFVSGYPLAAMFGLDRGFDVYDDRLSAGTGRRSRAPGAGHQRRRARVAADGPPAMVRVDPLLRPALPLRAACRPSSDRDPGRRTTARWHTWTTPSRELRRESGGSRLARS